MGPFPEIECLPTNMRCLPPILFVLIFVGRIADATDSSTEGNEFFRSEIEPLLSKHCFECHSHERSIKGGLALDSRAGWVVGGDGGPAIVPNAPDQSRLIIAVRHATDELRMPPKVKLGDDEIALLERWVKQGAPDPRTSVSPPASSRAEWDALYQERLNWWSLRPVVRTNPPSVRATDWPRNAVDNFILAGLEKRDLRPAREADRRTLARRLSFALTGLPPDPKSLERYIISTSRDADDEFVQSLIESPSFGEHWARHWMDVVHYTDTHGYEWDIPAKNAWRYRDYLVRAFNRDVPFDQMILEQIAGDLITPRIDPETGLNESIIGPMAMRLGERRHGDNSALEGISQEAIANVIDTVSKGFLATTVGCSQCHDHKLDAVEQQDYYGLAGTLMSTRWGVRCADAVDPNLAVLEELKQVKLQIRQQLAKTWLGDKESLISRILATPAEEPEKPKGSKSTTPTTGTVPESATAIWHRMTNPNSNAEMLATSWERLSAEFASEREKRVANNAANLRLMADFSTDALPSGWQIEGFGMKHGQTRDGEIVIAEEGGSPVAQILPAGRWSHVWSTRLAGAVRSPLLAQNPPVTFSIEFSAGKCGAFSFVVEQSFHGENITFINKPTTGWRTLTAGNFPALSGGTDHTPRRVYLEMVTKSLNNNFPPRAGLGGVPESEIPDERSWIGVTRIYEHAPGKTPQDELGRFRPLFTGKAAPATQQELAERLAELLISAAERWNNEQCNSEDVKLINDALRAKWLLNEAAANSTLDLLVSKYRETEKRLQPDRTVGSVADWNEGRDERVGIRGSYTDFGRPVPRGNVRFLGGPLERTLPESCGRLEFAMNVASHQNPLTARVIVNRVWQYLFGSGLVRTPDDFGHLGELPSHPELLDDLAAQFMDEGWSIKKLVKTLVTSATWRQSSIPSPEAMIVDPENRLWHHLPMRRLEAETIRDALLSVAGRLDSTMYGPPIDPPRAAEDAAKRLFSGPLDGHGRRSLYLKMTLMEPPRFLAIFNQPLPKLTVGKRDATNVPDQALTLLNDPFVVAMAEIWSKCLLEDGATSPTTRLTQMFATAFSRPPTDAEVDRLLRLADRSANARGFDTNATMNCQPVWQDVAHAIFNLKEFIYVQ